MSLVKVEMSPSSAVYAPLPLDSIPVSKEVTEFSSFIVASTSSPDVAVLSSAHKTTATWLTILSDRLGTLRAKMNDISLEQTERDKAKLDFEDDKPYFDSYKKLISVVKDDIRDVKAEKSDIERRILLLTDQNARTQAIATIHLHSHKVFVNTLTSAPWNLPMNASIDPEHEDLKVKGAGTNLMRLIYEIAQQENKGMIELKPLNGSVSFYQHLGMNSKLVKEGVDPGLYFTMKVDKENVPKELAKIKSPVSK